ncbi:MAG TPA: acetolactate decarboxylase [Patescibacteria group bacterium]|nr:acetolactate decarboxylase [Patescibacteria group bacterium]
MNVFVGFSILSMITLSTCGTGNKEPEDLDIPVNAVRVSGAMKNVMRNGQLHGTIALDTISNREKLIGLGPVELLKGEITVIDGKSYVSKVTGESSMRVEETFTVKAPFFVYAEVEKWKETALPDSIITLLQVENYLGSLPEKVNRPFAFKISATVESAAIHVVNLPEGASVQSPEDAHQGQRNFEIYNESVDMAGFFSTEHKAVFTHHDTFIHVHLITKDRAKMGHLDDVKIKRGSARLYIPAGE